MIRMADLLTERFASGSVCDAPPSVRNGLPTIEQQTHLASLALRWRALRSEMLDALETFEMQQALPQDFADTDRTRVAIQQMHEFLGAWFLPLGASLATDVDAVRSSRKSTGEASATQTQGPRRAI